MEQHQKKKPLSNNWGQHGSNMLTMKLFLKLHKKHISGFLAGIEQ